MPITSMAASAGQTGMPTCVMAPDRHVVAHVHDLVGLHAPNAAQFVQRLELVVAVRVDMFDPDHVEAHLKRFAPSPGDDGDAVSLFQGQRRA